MNWLFFLTRGVKYIDLLFPFKYFILASYFNVASGQQKVSDIESTPKSTIVHFCFSSVHFSRSVMSDSLQPYGLQHARPPCPSPTPGVHPNSCVSSRWCYPAISYSVVPFSSCLQSFPASGSFLMSQFFASGGQRIGVSSSASVLPMKIQDRFPLGWTSWISLQSKGLSRVFSKKSPPR